MPGALTSNASLTECWQDGFHVLHKTEPFFLSGADADAVNESKYHENGHGVASFGAVKGDVFHT